MGCALIGMGPTLSAFLVFVAPRPLLVVLSTLSAFGWLASTMIAASFRSAFSALVHDETWMLWGPLSAALQELLRAFFVKGYISVEANVKSNIERDRNSLKTTTLLGPLVAINDTSSAIGEWCWLGC